jgi:hypothetical protein
MNRNRFDDPDRPAGRRAMARLSSVVGFAGLMAALALVAAGCGESREAAPVDLPTFTVGTLTDVTESGGSMQTERTIDYQVPGTELCSFLAELREFLVDERDVPGVRLEELEALCQRPPTDEPFTAEYVEDENHQWYVDIEPIDDSRFSIEVSSVATETFGLLS